MRTYIEIGLDEFEIDFDYTITSRGCPATGPSYASGGEPAEPMEWEITGPIHLRYVTKEPFTAEWLEVPQWLDETITKWLQEDSRGNIHEAICEAAYGYED